MSPRSSPVRQKSTRRSDSSFRVQESTRAERTEGSNSVAAGDPANVGDQLACRVTPGPRARVGGRGARNNSAAVCRHGTARDGRYAPCSPSSSKIHGVGGSALAGHLSSVTLDPFEQSMKSRIPKRSVRRHHARRRKAWVRRELDHYFWQSDAEPRRVGLYANTPKPCSCWMCGNPRRFLHETTRQEKAAGDAEDYS